MSQFVDIAFEKWVEIGTNLIVPALAIYGVLATIPALRRKLKEDYISKDFEQMRTANHQLAKEAQSLLFKYNNMARGMIAPRSEQIKEIVSDLYTLTQKSFECTVEVNTLVSDLHYVFNEYLSDCDEEDNQRVRILGAFKFLNLVLGRVVWLATQVIILPSSIKFKKHQILVKKIEIFQKPNKLKAYEYQQRGVNTDPENQIALLFISDFNMSKAFAFGKYVDAIYDSPSPWAKLLHIAEIYVPPLLVLPTVGDDFVLKLIGFKFATKHDDIHGRQDIVVVYYGVPFNYAIRPQDFGSHYKDLVDGYILNSHFDIESNSLSGVNSSSGDVEITFAEELLRKMFVDNRVKMENMFKQAKKNKQF